MLCVEKHIVLGLKYIYGKVLRQELSLVNCPFSFGQGNMLNAGAELHFLSGEMPFLKLFK